jgi:biopolymer transport protein ExbB
MPKSALLCLIAMLAVLTAGPTRAWGAEPPASGDETGTSPQALDGGPPESYSIQQVIKNLETKFEAGGATMWAILFLSVLGLAFLLERAFRLRRGRIAPAGLADKANELWRAGDFPALEKLAHRYRRSTLGKIILFLIRKRRGRIESLSEAAGDIAGDDMTGHQMLLYPLAAIATLTPLLGLFGTVLGMIESFETVAVAGSMGDPTLLATGISKALVTTAFGLFVAIPALFFYHVLKLRTNHLNKVLERQTSSLINEWFLPGEKERP